MNNTISQNTLSTKTAPSGEGGGICCYSNSLPTVTNTIVWNNDGEEIHLDNSTITVSYSNIQGGWIGTGNIDADPLFAASGDYHLQDCSPCIGAGTSNGAPDTDVEGNPRGNLESNL